MKVKGIWIGYKKSGAYIASAWIMEDALDSFIKTYIHTDKEIEVRENMSPIFTNENGMGTVRAYTNSGWATVKVD